MPRMWSQEMQEILHVLLWLTNSYFLLLVFVNMPDGLLRWVGRSSFAHLA